MSSPSNLLFTRLSSILLKVSKLTEIENGPLIKAFELISIAACKGMNINRVSIWLLDPLKSYISCQITCDLTGTIHNNALILKEEEFPKYFKALLEERIIVANNAFTHPYTSEFTDNYLAPLGITSMLDCPIRLHGKMIGILCCENTGPLKNWMQEEQSFAASLAEFASQAILANERNVADEKLKALGN